QQAIQKQRKAEEGGDDIQRKRLAGREKGDHGKAPTGNAECGVAGMGPRSGRVLRHKETARGTTHTRGGLWSELSENFGPSAARACFTSREVMINAAAFPCVSCLIPHFPFLTPPPIPHSSFIIPHSFWPTDNPAPRSGSGAPAAM